MPISQNPADPTGMPQASPTLLPLLTPEDELPEDTEAREWYLFSESKSRLAGPAPTKEALAAQVEGGEIPEGAEYFVVPEGTTVLTCGHATNDEAAAAQPCPGGVSAASPWYYLYRYEPDAAEDPSPALTGEDLNADGTRQDFGTRRAAERPPRLHGRGRGQVPRHHADALPARADPGRHEPGGRPRPGARLRAELRDRPRQRDPLVPDHRLHRPAARRRDLGRQRRDHGPRQPRRGEGPGARPPDRRPARRVRPGRADADLRHAR